MICRALRTLEAHRGFAVVPLCFTVATRAGLPATLCPRPSALYARTSLAAATRLPAERLRTAMRRLTDAYTWCGVGEADCREPRTSLREQLAKAHRAPDERRVMGLSRRADFGLAWEKARPERRHEMLDVLFGSVTIGGKHVVPVKPRDEVPLFALKVLQSGGPDRGRTRNIEHCAGS